LKIIIVVLCFFYFIRVLIIKIASKKCRQTYKVIESELNEYDYVCPKVSVIVPARNEENCIERCILSLLDSNYPVAHYELIIVNDRSTDKTLDIIEKLANQHKQIKICNITTETVNPNLRGKPGAIQAGINISCGDIILMTDADCKVHKNWISSIANQFKETLAQNIHNKNIYNSENTHSKEKSNDKPLGMVCSYTNLKADKPFHYFQAAEWAYMHTMASAGIWIDTVLGCFGNNIAISKEAFTKIGGYENLKFSVTEDYVLLNAVFNAGFQVRYLCEECATVETLPVETFSEYMSQHKRWAIGGTALGFKAALYVFSSVCLWLAIIISFLIGDLYLLVISVSLRFIGDALILFPIFDKLETRYLKKWIPFSVIFYSFIELILPFTLFSKNVKWKNQIFETKK
jgi:cellulose synthase/poly-beta-1,6-N-acetylglucosamine synthase-like glycosyltransferase